MELFEPDTGSEGLWPENIPAAEAFVAISGQMRCVPGLMSRPHWLGLDYAGSEAGLRLAGIEMTPQLWSEVRVIEAAATAALNGS